MARQEDHLPQLPPKVKAAFEYLYHTRMITEQHDAAIPPRDLTPLEKSVETAALRAVQQYLMGEMDFAENRAAVGEPERLEGNAGTKVKRTS